MAGLGLWNSHGRHDRPNIIYHAFAQGDSNFYTSLKPGLEEHYMSRVGKNQDQFWVVMFLGKPKSRGEIRLHSGDPFDAPLIDPKYFSEKEDVNELVKGILCH